jgi:hypothetical protein
MLPTTAATLPRARLALEGLRRHHKRRSCSAKIELYRARVSQTSAVNSERLADSRLRLDPRAGCRFALERTGERMLGPAQRHADEKKCRVVCVLVLIQDERDEHLFSHYVLSKRSLHCRLSLLPNQVVLEDRARRKPQHFLARLRTHPLRLALTVLTNSICSGVIEQRCICRPLRPYRAIEKSPAIVIPRHA